MPKYWTEADTRFWTAPEDDPVPEDVGREDVRRAAVDFARRLGIGNIVVARQVYPKLSRCAQIWVRAAFPGCELPLEKGDDS